MIRKVLAVAAFSGALVAQASALGPGPLVGVYGPKGNDTGGIIPWSPDNEQMAYQLAQENCGYYNKYAVPTSIHRVPGDFIAYRCTWEPPKKGSRTYR